MQNQTHPIHISVLVPYYRAKDYFEACLKSILAQTYPVQEILIADDENSPDSRAFLTQFRQYARIIPLPERQGVPGSRNTLVKAASCPWVAFQDADDQWAPSKLEQQALALNKHPDWVGCHTGVQTFNDEGVLNEYLNKPSPLTPADLILGSHVTPPSLLIRKSVIEALGYFDTSFTTSSDYEFSIRLTKQGYKLGFVPLPLTRVRRSSHGNISSNGLRTFKSHIKLVRKHRDTFIHYGGAQQPRRFLAKSLRESGGKAGGITGKLFSGMGRLIHPGVAG